MILLPMLYVGASAREGFEKCDWEILASKRLSRASATSVVTFSIISFAEMCSLEGLGGVSRMGGRRQGERLNQR